MRSYR
ncbi:hypothetical protein VN97_g13091, partial [Penicillium thymicola]